MLDEGRTPDEDVLAALPVFPLPNVVFMPGMQLPLSVFEPRYLALVDHVLTRCDGFFGVPLLVDQAREGLKEPYFEPVLGLGSILDHKELDGGRRLIRVEGLARVRTKYELEQRHAFREVCVELLGEPRPTPGESLEVLVAQVERLAKTFHEDDQLLLRSVLSLDDARVIVYALAALIPNIEASREVDAGVRDPSRGSDLRLQQRCLETECADARVQLLLDRVSRLVAVVGDSGQFPMNVLN